MLIYIVVGGAGKKFISNPTSAGYNGGGICSNWQNGEACGGGGATHIATKTGLLSSLTSYKEDILIVAGGGGGGDDSGYGGYGRWR